MPIPPPPPDLPERLGRVAMVARWRPVHLGHLAVLDGLLARADRVELGIGSPNRYDLRNPWTADEVEAMLRRVVGDALDDGRIGLFRPVDLGDGPRWAAMVADLLGELDLFVTANPWVWSIMRPYYRLCHPFHLVAPERRVPVDGTLVRRAMARGDDWRPLLPPDVAALLDEQGLVDRFRREFGLATLALDAPTGG